MESMHQLVLEDGTVLPGISVGAPGVAAGEACFTTAMTGYEEAVSDPSYVAQVLTDDAVRAQLVAEAREHVLRFDWSENARETQSVYAALTKRALTGARRVLRSS